MTIPGVVIASLAVLLILLWTLANWRFAGVGSAVRVFLIFALLAWMQISVARLGFLREWGIRPVPVFAVMFISVALVLWRVFSRLGGKLSQAPLVWLIGFQAFRFPLELALHKAFVDGLMPVQMSYSGLNFDIVTGITALIVAALAHKGLASKWLVIAWNAVGTILLFVIVAVAILSTPVFAAFGQDHLNTWIADAPYVLLPGILVPTALAGHLLLWRRLISRNADASRW